jgi:hypothetical protein
MKLPQPPPLQRKENGWMGSINFEKSRESEYILSSSPGSRKLSALFTPPISEEFGITPRLGW